MVKSSSGDNNIRSGLRDESAMSSNNIVTFESEASPLSSVNKQQIDEVEREEEMILSEEMEGSLGNTIEPQDVRNLEDGTEDWNTADASRNDWDNREVAEGLLLSGGVVHPVAPPTMDIMETTSSVAATGPPSFSSHRSILSNYSGSSDEDRLVDDDDENELAGLGVPSNCQTTGGTSSSTSLFSSRAQRIQAQLLHQRRLQNTARATRNHQVVMGKDELQSWMEAMTTRLEKAVQEVLTQQRKDFDRVTSLLQADSLKHTNIESRLHAQLMLQSESMVAMELKLMRLETKIQQKEQSRSRLRFSVIDEEEGIPLDNVPARTTHVLSSGASLVSAVTATSGLEDGGEDEEAADETGSVGDEQSSSTAPNQVARHHQPIDSILHNPIPIIQSNPSTISEASTRAIRALPTDDASSLATSFTNSTLPSTVVTASNPNAATTSVRRRPSEIDESACSTARSRSQSPLTVPSMATASIVPSVASSIVTTGAVASARDFRSRRQVGPSLPANLSDQSIQSRPLTNRVVSFVSDEPSSLFPPTVSNEVLDSTSMTDTLTLPDEIDNLSDIVDAFAASSNRWREEYEARLDSIQKRFSRD